MIKHVQKTFVFAVILGLLLGVAAMAQAAEFFGEDTEVYLQFVDQFGEPVSGVKARAYISTVGRFSIAGPGITSTPVLVSDAEGKVELKSGRAWSVDIRNIEKEGYDYKRQPLTFGLQDQSIPADSKYKLGYYKGTKNKPRVVKLWKVMQSAEAIIKVERGYYPEDVGEPYTINLLKQVMHRGLSKEGDLIIVMRRNSYEDRKSNPLWSFEISTVDGGIIQSHDLFMNEAPEDGYEKSWLLSSQQNDQDIKETSFKRKFYLKMNNGKFARLEIEFYPYFNRNNSALITQVWVNPSGSRNLLYDPSKRIYPR